MKVEKVTLPNGLRIVGQHVPYVGSACIGLWCRTGSINELPEEGGITHLIEHMLFKGTKSRTAKMIAEEIEGRGGMLNAFTDKEQTCYYCRVLDRDSISALDVLCDMVLNSLIDGEELKREQGVVVEEIKRGEDEPGDHVHDLHLEGLWEGHKIGLPVIGTRESVQSFSSQHLRSYMDRRYRGNNILVSIAGNIEIDSIFKAVEERLAGIPGGEPSPKQDRPKAIPGRNIIQKDVEQVHFCIGTEGVSLYDDELYPAAVFDGILGGGMSSRLFQEIREKRGLAYSVGSYSLAYTCGGAITVYGGTGQDYWPEVQKVIRDEFDKLMETPVPTDEIEKVKQSMSGTLALSLEGMNSRMVRMAKNEFNYGEDIPLETTLAKIAAVTSDEVQALAQRILPEEKLRTTAIGNID